MKYARIIVGLICTILLLANGLQVLFPLAAVAAESQAGRKEGGFLASTGDGRQFATLTGTDYYSLSLNGMQLGGATVDVKEEEGGHIALQIVGRVRSVIGSLFAIGYQGLAVLSPDPVQPSEAVIEERKGSKKKTYLLKFLTPNRALAVQTEEKRGRTPKRSQQEFVSTKLALDPFSAIFFVRSQDWRVGDMAVFDVLTGRKQYELRLSCRGETVVAHGGVMREAWEITLEARSVDAPGKVKLSGVIYLARDGSREILKITGKHRIGRIVAQMRESEGQVTRQSLPQAGRDLSQPPS